VIRDALREPFSDDTQGALLAGIFGDEESVKAGITGMIDHPQVDYSLVNYTKEPWALQPTQMISYVSCHDDMCLTDRLRSSIPGIKTDELIRLDLLAQTAVMLSQGVPFMLSGEEMLRDKKGVHNSFESPDSVNHLDWGNLNRYPQVFEYYKKLIALRKNHPAFRLGDSDLVRKHLEFFVAPKGVITFHLGGHAGGDAWEDIIVILNFNKDVQKVDILEEPFTVVCRDGVIDENGLGEVCTEQVEVAGQTAMVLKK
jgi:pullulanase